MAAVSGDYAAHLLTRNTFLEVVQPGPERLVIERAKTEPCTIRTTSSPEAEEVWYDCLDPAVEEVLRNSAPQPIELTRALSRRSGSKLEPHREELAADDDLAAANSIEQLLDGGLRPPPGLMLDRYETEDLYELPQSLSAPMPPWDAAASTTAALFGHPFATPPFALGSTAEPLKVEGASLASFMPPDASSLCTGLLPHDPLGAATTSTSSWCTASLPLAPPQPPPLMPPPPMAGPAPPAPPVTAPGALSKSPGAPAPELSEPSLPAPPSWDVALAGVMVDGPNEIPEVHKANATTVRMSNGWMCIHWAVDSRKLESRDKQAVSPDLNIPFPGVGDKIFKLVIHALPINDQKRGAGFKKAKGKGTVELKCVDPELPTSMPDIIFRICIGGGEKLQTPSPPISHNFAEHGVATSTQEWNFAASVTDAGTFLVTIAIAPVSVRGVTEA